MNKLFVYGTLSKGELTHRLPGYMMFKVKGRDFDFPVIQPYPWQDNQPSVFGTVVEVSDEELQRLDVYENVGHGMYERTKVFVVPLEGDTSAVEEVQAYVGGPALVYEPIPSGVWHK